MVLQSFHPHKSSLSARRAWIEIWLFGLLCAFTRSLSARRAWIEIIRLNRNKLTRPSVALRKESVDRNNVLLSRFVSNSVALRKESVDRNWWLRCWQLAARESLSARRAWIEMFANPGSTTLTFVALRKESVDRNVLWGRSDVFGWRRSPQGERG